MSASGQSSERATAVILRDSARAGEPDRYAAALLAPEGLASDLLALAACAAELARIPAQVKEPMMGQIRLQWWHDAIGADAIAGRTGHPVADAMTGMMARRGLDRALLDTMIEARLADISHELFPDDAAVLAHFDATEGRCFELGLRIAGAKPGPDLAAAAAAAGRAYGFARSLGRLPELVRAGAFPISAARLGKHGIAPEQLTLHPSESGISPAIAECCDQLRSEGRRELAAARTAAARLGNEVTVALLPLAMVEPYFAAQERVRSAPMERIADVTPLYRLWRLWRAHRRREV